jgi:hypothetical protein
VLPSEAGESNVQVISERALSISNYQFDGRFIQPGKPVPGAALHKLLLSGY